MMRDDGFKLLRGFTDKQSDKRTFVNVESLSLLKMKMSLVTIIPSD